MSPDNIHSMVCATSNSERSWTSAVPQLPAANKIAMPSRCIKTAAVARTKDKSPLDHGRCSQKLVRPSSYHSSTVHSEDQSRRETARPLPWSLRDPIDVCEHHLF